MTWQPPWHSLRPTARAILEREISPGRELPDVPFVQKRVDQVAHAMYELSQALEVPPKARGEAAPSGTTAEVFDELYETFRSSDGRAAPWPHPENRWAQELRAEIDALDPQVDEEE